MKLTKSEAETLLTLVEKDIRIRTSERRSTKRLEKLRQKLAHYMTLKGLPSK